MDELLEELEKKAREGTLTCEDLRKARRKLREARQRLLEEACKLFDRVQEKL